MKVDETEADQRIMYLARLGNIEREVCQQLMQLQHTLDNIRSLTRSIERDAKVVEKKKPFYRGTRGATATTRKTKHAYIVVSPALPGAVCSHCYLDGEVMKIKPDTVGSKTEPLHEACAELWFENMGAV